MTLPQPPYMPEDPEVLWVPSHPIDWTAREKSPLHQAYRALPFGAIRPRGWLMEQLQRDLHEGFVGVLDELVPDIFGDDVFGSDRRTRLRDSASTGSKWSVVELRDPGQLVGWLYPHCNFDGR